MMRNGRRNALKSIAGLSAYAGAAAVLPGTALAQAAPPAYKNASLPVELRVKDLLARMTLEEKCAQMIALWMTKTEVTDANGFFSPEKADKAYPASFGQMTRPSDRRGAPNIPNKRYRDPEDIVRLVNDTQRWALEKTRLGIPVLCHEECLHGYMAPDATMFPQAIALSGGFDLALMREVSSTIAREMRAHGSHLALSPVVDIARDPRWGRIEETFGEDTYLCSEMGVAAVLGLQGEGRTLGPGKVFATLKHMTGHGQPNAGLNVAPAPVGERELRESFFPPFREVVARTGISSVMPSYNEIDGVASHVNKWLIGDVLRGEWKFDGAVVSDYNAVEHLQSLHKVVPDLPEAAVRTLAAGVDSELPDGAAFRNLPALVRAGRVPESAIDAACGRMLSLKFRAGLFENPYAKWDEARTITGNAEARALALKASHRSICLLKNDGLLPLAAGTHKRVAVIGPNAAIARLGGYSSEPRQKISLLAGVQAKLAGKAEVVHAQGVFITQSEDRGADEVLLADPKRNRELIQEAVAVAKTADVILLAIGDTEQTSREGYATNHLGDRTSLDLVGEQNELVDALHALRKPLVIVAINGRPPSWPNAVAKCNALLECWYLAQEGGTAMADALFGDVNPGAKLPVTVVRDVSQVPFYYNARPVPRAGAREPVPLFPFGFGLSYTRFEIGTPRLSANRIGPTGSVTVEVDVHNTGKRAGDEVVQLYVRQTVASVARPVKQLKGFARVTLEPGEKRTVSIKLEARALALWNAAMKEVVETGTYDLMVGPNSRDLKKTTLTIA
ncbi:glycoside hydrolase family 3 N-terminal domain-containing protein [Usitatibacter palustris]|uniref:Beta-D-glucoside glucohydrolase n=1 Tax=Usitatibacter palustris TaxID=2732487 RepID=A0A6M4H7V9_9PROT|nr:glycoside hydrolase family 3 N-terminal domain-containing protein [Usitatibacter palustris]QJR15245.1 Beta-xylosidase [Usitatibacter palustris]